jgi:hypothetical protein
MTTNENKTRFCFLLKATIVFFISIAPQSGLQAQDFAASAKAEFKSPPSSAMPRACWHWTNSNITKDGITDVWSDPKGEFLAAVAAEPVYHLFGKKGVETTTMPAAGDSTMLNTLGYFMHSGGHGVFPADHEIFVKYLLKHLVTR